MNGVMVKAPAKLNLTLDILGKMENGYHSMDMLMQSVDLYEKIILTKKQQGISVRCLGSDGSPADGIPIDRHNTAFKAAMLFFEVTNLAGGVEIAITKTVPVKAGMGGASADAAGVLIGLNKLYDLPLTQAKLSKLAARVGADVPFAINGGTARVTGFGQEIQPIKALPQCSFVIIMPKIGVDTAQGFLLYDQSENVQHVNTNLAQAAIEKGDIKALARLQKNVMQPCCGNPETRIICNELCENGALTALMTGSGAAVYGVFETMQAAKAAIAVLKKQYPEIYLAAPCTCGAEIENTF